jgi:hypothetical protein
MQFPPLAPDRRTSRRRRALAAGLEHAVKRAHEPRRFLSAEIPVDRRAVADSEHRLLAIAAELRADRPIPDEGVDEVRRLVTDGTSPLFVGGDRLPHALTRAEIALGLR